MAHYTDPFTMANVRRALDQLDDFHPTAIIEVELNLPQCAWLSEEAQDFANLPTVAKRYAPDPNNIHSLNRTTERSAKAPDKLADAIDNLVGPARVISYCPRAQDLETRHNYEFPTSIVLIGV